MSKARQTEKMSKGCKRVDKMLSKLGSKKLEKGVPTPSVFALETPCRVLLAGSSGSGKTQWLIKYLATYGTKQFDLVLFCAPSASLIQPKLKVLKKAFGEFFVKIPCDNHQLNTSELDNQLTNAKTQGWHVAVVLDDLMLIARDKYISQLFISGRHSNISTFQLSQNILTGNKTARLNCSAYILFNFGQKREVTTLADQCTTTKSKAKDIGQAYEKIMKRSKHGCLILDMVGRSTKEWPSRARDTAMDVFIPELWDA